MPGTASCRRKKKRALEWSLADLLPGEGSDAERFPKYLALGDVRLALHYRFEPGASDDGVTLDVPLHLLNALDPARLSWLAPGFVADKATALIRACRRPCAATSCRRRISRAPSPRRIRRPERRRARGRRSRASCTQLTGVAVPALDFDEAALEPHLRMNLRLLESRQGKGACWPSRATSTTCARASASARRRRSPSAPADGWRSRD